jgi:SAM-dependent methyltransferase
MAGTEYDLEAGYSTWSHTYDRPLRLFPIEEPPMRRRIDRLPAGVALDAACGTGRYSTYLAERGHDVVGIDQSDVMLDRAREKLPDATFHQGDLTALPLDDCSVDAAVCALALVHVGDLGAAVTALARVVRPGGRVIVSDVHPVLISLGWQAQFSSPVGERGFMRLHGHDLSAYLRAALDAGLVICGCEEPQLTEEGAATPAADPLPAANRSAFVGLPAVVIWEFERPAVPSGR